MTTTTLNGTITASAKQITLTAFTNPGSTGISGKTLLQFATGEKCLVTDASLSPTLGVVRGYDGTTAAAHTTAEGVQYGLMGDPLFTEANSFAGQAQIDAPSTILFNAVEITATGVTGTDAAVVTAQPFAIINSTGATDAGVNLWVPTVGQAVVVHNDSSTGAVKVYSVGATIDGTTGTTAVSITITGSKGGMFACATAGAWRMVIKPT